MNANEVMEMNEVMIITEESIQDKIYVVREKQVMFDFDLAKIYGYATKDFNRQVKNNIERFDDDFMFKLTNDEFDNLRCKIFTSSWGGSRIAPYAFTEQGIYMLMTVLKGELATKQSKALIRIFKKMKDYIIERKNNLSYDRIIDIALQTEKNTNDIKQIKTELKGINKLIGNVTSNEFLILKGKQVEANLAYQKIYSYAKKSIYIIDNYIGLKTLALLKNINKEIDITIFSDNLSKQLHKLEYDDFVKEYPCIKIKFIHTNNKFHDRYVIIDYRSRNEKIFHCGASSKDAGNKITTISEINDKTIYHKEIEVLLNNEELKLR